MCGCSHGATLVRLPLPCRAPLQATQRRVLTMEWVEGVKLTNKAAMDAAGLDIVDFVDVGVECTLRQLLEHGYFHADPHPGNLLATREHACTQGPRTRRRARAVPRARCAAMTALLARA
jgi:predicted unusual protein kinase regulating ubiquinone biosynthesis (AarF/ABC1/UbiB family)